MYKKCLQSVEKVGGDSGYLDLMLIHTPSPGASGIKLIWQSMEKLHDEGKIKSLGVSNFGIAQIEHMKTYAKVWPPTVNQLELHLWCQQREIVEYCHKNNIIVEAYCPLVRNQKAKDPTLTSIANEHNTSTQQVLIRYCLQKGWVPLPKSDNPKRSASNADVFNIQLDEQDMKQLDDRPQEPALVIAVNNKSSK